MKLGARAKYLIVGLCWLSLMVFWSPGADRWLNTAWAGPGQRPERQSIPTLTPTPGPTAVPSATGIGETAVPGATAATPRLPSAPTLLALTRSPGAVETTTRRAWETAESLSGGGEGGEAIPTSTPPVWPFSTSRPVETVPDASLAVTPLPAAPEHVLPANACVNLAVCLIGVVLLLAGLRLMRRR